MAEQDLSQKVQVINKISSAKGVVHTYILLVSYVLPFTNTIITDIPFGFSAVLDDKTLLLKTPYELVDIKKAS